MREYYLCTGFVLALVAACGKGEGNNGAARDGGDLSECLCDEDVLLQRSEQTVTFGDPPQSVGSGGSVEDWGLYTACSDPDSVLLAGGCTLNRHDSQQALAWHGFYTPSHDPDAQPQFDRWTCASSGLPPAGSGEFRSVQALCAAPNPDRCSCAALGAADFARRIRRAQTRLPLRVVNQHALLSGTCPVGTALIGGSCSLLGPPPGDPAWSQVVLSRSGYHVRNFNNWQCGATLLDTPDSEYTMVLDMLCLDVANETADDKVFFRYFNKRLVLITDQLLIDPETIHVEQYSCGNDPDLVELLWGGCMLRATSDETFTVKLLSSGFPATAPGEALNTNAWECVWDNPHDQRIAAEVVLLCLEKFDRPTFP